MYDLASQGGCGKVICMRRPDDYGESYRDSERSMWRAAAGEGRFERLFADMEAELAAADSLELSYEVADRARGEFAQMRMVDRLRAAVGASIVITVPEVGAVTGELRDVGADWLLLKDPHGAENLIPLHAVRTVDGLPALSAQPGSEGKVEAGRGLRVALRRLARDRVQLRLHVGISHPIDATIDRVGNDFIEVAVHPIGEPRRARAVRQVRCVMVPSLVLARSIG